MKTSNTHEYEVFRFNAMERSLRYKDGEDFAAWQATARAKLGELLGLPLEKGACRVELEYEKSTERGTEYRFTVETEPGYLLPCRLPL